LKGKRAFLDHHFRFNKESGNNNLYLTHQINFEYKYFEFNQATLATTLDEETPPIQRFGPAYITANINDQVRYNRMYNRAGAVYENSVLGKFTFFIDDFRYNYFYNRVIFDANSPGIGLLSDQINSIGGQYEYRKNKWRGKFLLSNSISNQPMSNLD